MADQKVLERLRGQAFELKKDLLAISSRTFVHIGGDLSAADFMTVIWQYAMRYDPKEPKWPARDRFVLSKGHAAAVTTFSQTIRGCYDVEQVFAEYGTNFGRFGMHSCNLINPYVEVSTGSLGHGLPVAVGLAEAVRKKGLSSRVFVVMGDGETDEGSIWEAAMLANALKLGNLIGFVDRNRLQFDGMTEDEHPLEPYADKWRAFGWNVVEVDGHDMAALIDVADALPEPGSKQPTVVICRTVKGHGVSFMENQIGWHGGMLTPEQYKTALQEITAAYERGE